jgi:hypothetical protein
MELDRPARYLEVLVCLLWVILLYVRMRSVLLDPSGPPLSARLRGALRPIRLGAGGLMIVAVVLWTEARWQPFAHAITVPSLLFLGLTQVLVAIREPRLSGEGVPSGKAG